ncbi:MAG: tRNA (guanosine(46)-N7)-methyltransferase TrmB [Hydrogenoanaerobacterium sp.]
MRLRRKPWAKPELDACPFYTEFPSRHRGRWAQWFGNENPIFLELGCGKGGFIAPLAVCHPENNYLAVDLKDAVLGLAKRKIELAYAEAGQEPSNIRLMTQDIERLFLMLEDNVDVISRIYINFCNPWHKIPQQKKRLTHPRQLKTYKRFLADEAEIWFKTDDEPLFNDTLLYLDECGFTVKYQTRDLRASGFSESLPTEHEDMFAAEGIPIKFLIAVNHAL